MQEVIELQPIMKDFLFSNLKSLNFCCPARIEGVQFVEQGRVDVRPLNIPTYADLSSEELPVIKNVPLITPSFVDSGMVFTPKQGDTVLLVFPHCSMDEFKGGSVEPYAPMLNRFLSINDAVAIAGLTPFNLNPINTIRHYHDYDKGDVSLFNNLGKAKENKINIKKDGTNRYIAKTHNIDGDTNVVGKTNIKGDTNVEGNTSVVGDVSITGNLTVSGDIIIQGRSLLQFMNSHTHPYRDDGNPMITAPPIPI